MVAGDEWFSYVRDPEKLPQILRQGAPDEYWQRQYSPCSAASVATRRVTQTACV